MVMSETTCVGRVKAGPMTYAGFSAVDNEGLIAGHVGEAEFTDDALETFGCAGVARIPRLQHLICYICEKGFEHPVDANLSSTAAALEEVVANYLGWRVSRHDRLPTGSELRGAITAPGRKPRICREGLEMGYES
jgi:hypothetical protein